MLCGTSVERNSPRDGPCSTGDQHRDQPHALAGPLSGLNLSLREQEAARGAGARPAAGDRSRPSFRRWKNVACSRPTCTPLLLIGPHIEGRRERRDRAVSRPGHAGVPADTDRQRVRPQRRDVPADGGGGEDGDDHQQSHRPDLSDTRGAEQQGRQDDKNDKGINQEYRVYVGYSQGGTNYFGLLPGQSITVPIPQAIWDSGRLDIVADTPETAQTFLSSGLPFNYSPSAATNVEPITGTDGVLFLYHDATPKGIGADAPSQLVEWSVRDKSVTPDVGTSVDYDLSYLDHMYLPVAVEANPGPGHPGKAGYIGTTLTGAQFQSTLQKFVSGSLLNGYFGGQGWPEYDLGTSNPNDPIKIPGGYNILELTPPTNCLQHQ